MYKSFPPALSSSISHLCACNHRPMQSLATLKEMQDKDT
jgi:hypothetical protein